MAWVTPKTNWVAGEGIFASDINKIEGNIEHIELGTRLIDDDATLPAGDSGALRNILDYYATQIARIISPTFKWNFTPPISLAELAVNKLDKEWARRSVRLSGYSTGSFGIIVNANDTLVLQSVAVNVPAGKKLNLMTVRCSEFGNLRLRIQRSGAASGDIYTATSAAFDTTAFPDGGVVKELYENTGGSTATVTLQAIAVNSTGSQISPGNGAGWELWAQVTA